jgi:hypothetical protein
VTRQLWRDLRPGAYGHGSEGKGGGWPGLRQALRAPPTREPLDPSLQTIVSERTFLTSLPPRGDPRGQPKALLGRIRGHWGIGNKLHQAKDRSLGEDAERSGPAAVALSRLRRLAIGPPALVPGHFAPDQFQAVLADDTLASNLIAQSPPAASGNRRVDAPWRNRLAGAARSQPSAWPRATPTRPKASPACAKPKNSFFERCFSNPDQPENT